MFSYWSHCVHYMRTIPFALLIPCHCYVFRTLCDVDRDGQLTSAEFSMAVYVIFCRKSGVPMPRALPPSLVQSASVSASPAQPGILGQVQTPASQQGFSGQVMRSAASPLVAKSSLPGSGLVCCSLKSPLLY